MSAEAANAAFSVIREHTALKEKQHGKRIILATVKGDIHDIGKNIVKVLLESYGFTVYDLGRDVRAEVIVSEAKKRSVSLVGLSALMTTTVASMKETIDLMKAEAPEVKVMVGGAVLTQKYADMIGADKYCRDAMQAVRYAEEVFSN
jgi:5-methyltetrahydrofolate--homocysteine methyltransferase